MYLANNDIMLLQRDLKERWWRTSDRYMRFVDEFGREYTFPANAHWILFWVEVLEGQLEEAKLELQQEKKELAEKMEVQG